MGDYVICKLKNKHFEVDFLIVDQPYVDPVNINLIDRGGLAHITDDFFKLFANKLKHVMCTLM